MGILAMTDLLGPAVDAVAQSRVTLDKIGRHLAGRCAEEGRVSTEKLNAIQPEAFELARHLARAAMAEAIIAWARPLDDHERSLASFYSASSCAELERWTRFNGDALGLEPGQAIYDGRDADFIYEQLKTQNVAQIGERVISRDKDPAGTNALADMHAMVQSEFAKFADKKVRPLAEHIHCQDKLIDEGLLKAMAELGVFGISIPEEFGGTFFDHRTMIIATEELSRGSLGAGGSVITRPEICAKAILKGGTDEQKAKWLPLLASGERVISVAVTEPDAGSDVARLKATARKVEGGYVLNGEKTWCTFAGRADVLCVLARTGSTDDGHRGLTLFLVEKEGRTSEDAGDEYKFEYAQPDGGTMAGNAIPTIGYRGMHSFSVAFEDWFVPDGNRIGEEGKGFYLQMAGFAGGRIQTAARAVGVMEAAFREAIAYVGDRKAFGEPLSHFTLTKTKLAEMAARIQAGRQLSYAVGDLMDRGQGQWKASLVKFMTCKDAEWVTREAMQLHGGMGYSEEYPVSRFWQDARVLSIFEGAEEVLALLVIARQYFTTLLKDSQA